MAAALADRLGDIALAPPEFLHEPAVGLGLLERRQILALQVFDQRDLQHLGIAERTNDDRDLVQPGALRRAPAPLAGNQLEFGARIAGIVDEVVDRTHQQRLHDPLLADRLHEPIELGFRKTPPRLEWRRADCLDRHGARRPWPAQYARAALAEQCRQAAPELRSLRAITNTAAHAAAPCRSRAGPAFRRSISAARSV